MSLLNWRANAQADTDSPRTFSSWLAKITAVFASILIFVALLAHFFPKAPLSEDEIAKMEAASAISICSGRSGLTGRPNYYDDHFGICKDIKRMP